MTARIDIATNIAACALTLPIQEEVWGDSVVPPALLLAVANNGGFVALGYADGDLRPAGFLRAADGRGAYLLVPQPRRGDPA